MKNTITTLLFVFGFAIIAQDGFSGEQWVRAIRSSTSWAVFPCKHYIITDVCGTDKDYNDPGRLPPIISVGDTIRYISKDGKRKSFTVRHINFFVYDEAVDFKWEGKRYTAKKGETSCTLYDVADRSKTRETEYPSKIIITNCRQIH